jgi:hypothetical protein
MILQAPADEFCRLQAERCGDGGVTATMRPLCSATTKCNASLSTSTAARSGRDYLRTRAGSSPASRQRRCWTMKLMRCSSPPAAEALP